MPMSTTTTMTSTTTMHLQLARVSCVHANDVKRFVDAHAQRGPTRLTRSCARCNCSFSLSASSCAQREYVCRVAKPRHENGATLAARSFFSAALVRWLAASISFSASPVCGGRRAQRPRRRRRRRRDAHLDARRVGPRARQRLVVREFGRRQRCARHTASLRNARARVAAAAPAWSRTNSSSRIWPQTRNVTKKTNQHTHTHTPQRHVSPQRARGPWWRRASRRPDRSARGAARRSIESSPIDARRTASRPTFFFSRSSHAASAAAFDCCRAATALACDAPAQTFAPAGL